MQRAILTLSLLALPLLTGATAPGPTPTAVALLWHQHQPRYPQRPGTRVFEQPWVRLHTTKDYADMVKTATRFKGLRVSFNLTPVLLEQIDAYNQGATDRHAELAQRDPASWTLKQKEEASRRFFQVSPAMLRHFPRLAALRDRPWRSLTTQDWRDAVVLFHLAWTDTDWLTDPSGQRLLNQHQNFSHTDALTLLARHRDILAQVIPLHRQAQQTGAIEVSTTPYYHPILPLLHNTQLASEAMSADTLPAQSFAFPDDARYHVQTAATQYKARFGCAPRGMWPGEGSVAQAVMPLFADAGIRWVATDEEVLARSLGYELTGAQRDALYQPFQEPNGVALLFRDRKLSDDIGFRYGQMDGQVAAADLLQQIEAIAQRNTTHPRLISIILDGENAWEHYPDDGKAFLNAFYQGLTHSRHIYTTTPSQYLKQHHPAPLKHLWAGSWINASFGTWIGEADENRAWDALRGARTAVQQFGKSHGTHHPAYQKALKTLYVAEGSDWFWWYGCDQESGHDDEFDTAYRNLLASAYRTIGQTPPPSTRHSLSQATPIQTPPKGPIQPTIDGVLQRQEWAQAGACFAPNGVMSPSNPVAAFFYGQDTTHLYVGIQYTGEAVPCQVQAGTLTLVCDGKTQAPAATTIATGRFATEIAIPLSTLNAGAETPLTLQVHCQSQTLPHPPLTIKFDVDPAHPSPR